MSAGRNLIKKIRTFPSRRKVRIFCFTLFLFHRLVQLLDQGVALLDGSGRIHGFLGLFHFFLRSIQRILGGGKLRIVGLALVFLGDGIVIILGGVVLVLDGVVVVGDRTAVLAFIHNITAAFNDLFALLLFFVRVGFLRRVSFLGVGFFAALCVLTRRSIGVAGVFPIRRFRVGLAAFLRGAVLRRTSSRSTRCGCFGIGCLRFQLALFQRNSHSRAGPAGCSSAGPWSASFC